MDAVDDDVVLEASGIHKSFGGVMALRDASLRLRRGEVHGLIGENGAGKSTLIKILTGFYQPDGGTLRLGGQEVSFARPAESQEAGVSTVYQEVNLIPERTVADNIMLGRQPRRALLIDRRATDAEARAVLERYGLTIDPRAKLSALSLGLQQMVAIVRAVATESKVVILDEPTSALTGHEIEVLFDMVRRLRADGTAVLFVSHRMSELYELCDRFTVLRDGAVAAQATPQELPRAELVRAMLGGVSLDPEERDPADVAARRTALAAQPVRLSVRDLTWRNRVRGVSFDVRAGEIVGLLGLLGSGRTETCKAIFGALRPDGGEVLVDGKRLVRATPGKALRAGVAYLSEDRRSEGIFDNLSVAANMTAASVQRLARAGLVNQAAERRLVTRHAEALRLKSAGFSQPVSQLSGGNQQKVLLGRWLSLAPKVVLLDDPTRGIDVGAKAEVHRVVRALASDGIAVVVTSSETEELLVLCDRLVALSEGRLVGEVDPSQADDDTVLALLSGEAADDPSTVGGARR
jgi:ribose transport system ATP-binding protein